jgi:biotin transport system substrate-specific component
MSIDQQTAGTRTIQEALDDPRARRLVGIAGFVLATTLGAYVAVPLPWTPVPMTLQPLFVILAGALLGPWAGASAMAAYVALGAMGAPVFSMGRAGLPWLMGPTGGYLIAYPAAAFVAGAVLRGGSRGASGTVRALAGLTLGLAVIYLGGVSQLAMLTGQGAGELLALGVMPFLAGDLVKVLIALVVVRLVRAGRDARGSDR